MPEKQIVDDGGPAFPRLNLSDYPGVTLRDYFAAKALQGILHIIHHKVDKIVIAKDAYEQADAMLKVRNGGIC